jgi:purine-binding chemotaxis protein CheW
MAREATSPVEAMTSADSAAPWAFFMCAGKGYAFRLDQIHEIVPPQRVTRLPGCGPAVSGLIGLRGRVITVFDLGVLTGGRAATENPAHRVLLVRRGDRIVGLAVEELVTIAALGDSNPASIESNPAEGPAPDSVMMSGRTFTILDPDQLVGPLFA